MQRADPHPRPDDERTALTQFLDYQRATILQKVDGLTDDELARTTAASRMTLSGLLSHLAFAEDLWFRTILLGAEPAPLWRDWDWDADEDWDWRAAKGRSRSELVALYTEACAASRAAVASVASLDALAAARTPYRKERYNLRWIMLHMFHETARHNGHADLLRESIDGATGV